MNMIEMAGVTKSYGKTRGVTALQLEVNQGEIFGFIGPNGAGKSTTIRMIMQLLSPDEGGIRVLGVPLDRERPELRRRIGYLPSELAVYPGMSGRDMLEFAAAAHGMKLSREEVNGYAERLGWDPDRKIKLYSLGNRKKLGIILSLLHNPDLLVLDEPTSGLDPLIQNEFFHMLKERNEQRGMTVFFSTHVLSEVEKVCGRVAFIKEGRLNRVSKIDELSSGGDHLVTVRFQREGDCTEAYGLAALDPQVTFDGMQHHLRTGDRLPAVLERLAGLPVRDLTIRRPTIEELFMDDYRKDGGEQK
ncbi:ABC transporter ATP-binding protein [Paenibacillus sp. CN-4]|uniref:ABC transporter ATP-binding protein n=1 Tax=Paenibacillus nanchangensis TaxID=3348343 RepID=UPI00397C4FA8